jgi:hypothetical protein
MSKKNAKAVDFQAWSRLPLKDTKLRIVSVGKGFSAKANRRSKLHTYKTSSNHFHTKNPREKPRRNSLKAFLTMKYWMQETQPSWKKTTEKLAATNKCTLFPTLTLTL